MEEGEGRGGREGEGRGGREGRGGLPLSRSEKFLVEALHTSSKTDGRSITDRINWISALYHNEKFCTPFCRQHD